MPTYSSFESISLNIFPIPTILMTIYRPPKYNTIFLTKLSEFLTYPCSMSSNVIMLGDFNMHIDYVSNASTREFLSCLESFGMQKFTSLPNHSNGHVLNLICCSGINPYYVTLSYLAMSDPLLVFFCAQLTVFQINLCCSLTFQNI